MPPSTDSTDRQRRSGVIVVNFHNNSVVVPDAVCAEASTRTYFDGDVRAAIAAWGRLDSYPGLAAKSVAVIAEIELESGASVHDVYIPESEAYVAITFSDNPDLNAAWINVGYVDHRWLLPKSVPIETEGRSVFRRRLSPTIGDRRASDTSRPVTTLTCPHCFIDVPVTGACGHCDWVPGA